ncbi:MAG: aminotransferase class V-fold PLP-dependent enzyme [Chloroflexota bacterium]|nr:aminotransferase class V-fold PLP-dependent enzyme [Chloroflexota bacterium]
MARPRIPVYQRLGVKTIVHASGTTTRFGGTLLLPAALEAMAEASLAFVDIDELNARAGEALARVCGAEAGLVTSGAAAGLVLQAAACMTGADPAKVARIPDTEGMRNEIVIQRGQRIQYDQAYRQAGAKLVEVGYPRRCAPWDLEGALNERTAAVAFIETPYTSPELLSLPAVAEIAHRHGLPVIVDAASTLPPKDNLRRFVREGGDMVIISGGKGVRGPQSTGILAGRKDLIEAATLNSSPNAGIGRPMKTSKEEIVGLVTALEHYDAHDEEPDMRRWRAQMQQMVDALVEIPGIRPVVEHDRHNHLIPHAVVYFDGSWRGPSTPELLARLRQGDPPIYMSAGGFAGELVVDPFSLQEGEVEIVARRLYQVLTER